MDTARNSWGVTGVGIHDISFMSQHVLILDRARSKYGETAVLSARAARAVIPRV